MLPGRKLQDLVERVIPRLGHQNDGVVFTPACLPYYCGTDKSLFKWKPRESITVDFRLSVEEMDSRPPKWIVTKPLFVPPTDLSLRWHDPTAISRRSTLTVDLLAHTGNDKHEPFAQMKISPEKHAQ